MISINLTGFKNPLGFKGFMISRQYDGKRIYSAGNSIDALNITAEKLLIKL